MDDYTGDYVMLGEKHSQLENALQVLNLCYWKGIDVNKSEYICSYKETVTQESC